MKVNLLKSMNSYDIKGGLLKAILFIVVLFSAFYKIHAQTTSCDPNSPVDDQWLSPNTNYKCILGDVYLDDAIANGDLLPINCTATDPQYIIITGTLHITEGYNFYWGSEIVMANQNAKIVVENGLFELYGTHIYGANTMWDKILIKNSGSFEIVQGSLIEDAVTAIKMEDGAWCSLSASTFKNNKTSVYAADISNFINVTVSIDGCNFIKGSNGMKMPELGGTPNYAVFGKNVYNLNLGGPHLNTVTDHLVGIKLSEVNFNISNWSFTNLGTGIDAEARQEFNLDIKGKITGSGISANSPYTFNNISDKAIYLNKLNDVEITNCKSIYTDFTCFYITGFITGLTNKYKINYNDISNIGANGIMIGSIGNTDLVEIKNNHINTTTWSSPFNTSPLFINVSGIGGKLSGLNIKDNIIIDYETNGMNNSLINAIGVNSVLDGGSITGNTVTINDLTSIFHCIDINNCDKMNIKFNTLTGPGLVPNIEQVGLMLLDSPNCDIGCNTTDALRNGIVFQGICDGTKTTLNEIKNHKTGFLLEGTTTKIGEQFDRYNKWLENSVNYGADAYTVQPSYWDYSKFNVTFNTKKSIYWPEPINPSFGWFKKENDISNPPNTCSNIYLGTSSTTKADQDLIENKFPSLYPFDEFDQKLYLYGKLDKDVSLKPLNSGAETFFNNNQNTIIGNLYNIELGINGLYSPTETENNSINDLIVSKNILINDLLNFNEQIMNPATNPNDIQGIRDDISDLIENLNGLNVNIAIQIESIVSEKLNTANNLYNALISFYSSDEWILDRLKVDQIKLEKLFVELNPSSATILTEGLEEIAGKCRFSDGLAVSMARNMLNVSNDDVLLCNLREYNNSKLKDINSKNLVYPNPFNDHFTIELANNEVIDEILITDILGNVIPFKIEKDKNTVLLENGNLEHGVYNVKLKTEGGNFQIFRLIK